ncbi:hypothetical protein TNCV_4655991 [Trichonephila clavipes]|nr:hypothetical protein TNCV_4655991 [Trichonephila clavipes]
MECWRNRRDFGGVTVFLREEGVFFLPRRVRSERETVLCCFCLVRSAKLHQEEIELIRGVRRASVVWCKEEEEIVPGTVFKLIDLRNNGHRSLIVT